MDINALLRAEIDLPDDAPHVEVMNLLGLARDMFVDATDKADKRTIGKVMDRLTARIVPPKLDGRIDPKLLMELIEIGNEIEAVNKHRAALYERAGSLMQSAVDAGMSQAEVARIVGVDRSTVRSAVSPVAVATAEVRKARPSGERRSRLVKREDGTTVRIAPRPKPKPDEE